MGIASPDDFKRGNTSVITLPESGLDVLARRVSLANLIETPGAIPDPLAGAAARYAMMDPPPAESDEDRRKNLRDIQDIGRHVAIAMILEPKCTLDGADGTLDVHDIPEADITELYLVATGRTGRWDALRRFPGVRENLSVDVAQGGEGVRDEAAPAGGVGGATDGLGGPLL